MIEPMRVVDREIDTEELIRMNSHMGLPPVQFRYSAGQSSGALRGSWLLYGEGQGLSMHCGQFEELSDLSHSLELPAGLSLTFMLAGQVSFALGGQRFTIGERIQPVECACFALAKPEVLTRNMQKGRWVSKLNIFVERAWLQRRFRSALESEQLEQIFLQHAQLCRWQPSPSAVALCQSLLEAPPAQTFAQQLTIESRLLALVAEVIEHWVEQLQQVPALAPSQSVENMAEAVKQHIDSETSNVSSLQALADRYHVSVSTLQRRFKASYGTTVMGYKRQKHLERAKSAIVCEGLSIGEAAYLAGYSYVGNFIAAFTKAYAMSPAEYRKLHQMRTNG